MSLINKMLRDLEARQQTMASAAAPAAVYEDLAAVPRLAVRVSHKAVTTTLLVFAVLAGSYAAWTHWPSAPTAAITATPAPEVGAGTPPAAVVPSAGDASPHTVASIAPPPAPAAAAPVRPVARPPAPEIAGGDISKVAQPLSAADQAESAYRHAVVALQQGRSNEADESLRRAVRLDARHSAAREALVGLLLQRGHGEEAQALLAEGTSVTPQHYRFAQLAARLAVEQGADARALELLERGAAYARQDPEYQAFHAALLQRAGRHDEAARHYRLALEARPLESRWWLGLAITLESQQRSAEAAEAYGRSLQGAALDTNLRRFAQQRLTALKK